MRTMKHFLTKAGLFVTLLLNKVKAAFVGKTRTELWQTKQIFDRFSCQYTDVWFLCKTNLGC